MSILSKSSLLGVLLASATAGAQTPRSAQQPATSPASAAHDSTGKMAGTTKGRKHNAARRSSARRGAMHDSAAAKPAGTPK